MLQREHIGCILVVVNSPAESLAETLEALKAMDSTIAVAFYCTAFETPEVVRLIQAGAADCFDRNSSVVKIRKTLMGLFTAKTAIELRAHGKDPKTEPWRANLIGQSLPIQGVADTIRLVGPRRCTVLISGETGTGKEMAARGIHGASPRARRAMVAINCSALPEHLLEAELFGHTKGAFTGAANLRIGRFEQANQSTIFLDEIGDMPLELQAKLLRVLQDREIQRLGSSETVKIDVRVIAASNVDLAERVQQGRFRADLFYRLNVVPLHMPTLRQRTSDIPMLVEHFIVKICNLERLPLKRVAPEALERLCRQPWPGNIRQLENSIEMAVAVSGARELLCSRDFGLAVPADRWVPLTVFSDYAPDIPEEKIHFDTAVTQFQLTLLNNALKQASGNKTRAAADLGLNRTTLIMKLRALNAVQAE